MFEIIFEIFFEILLQLFLEVLANIGSHYITTPYYRGKKENPVFSFIAYSVLGLIAGHISLFLFPANFIKSIALQRMNLLVTPILLGYIFSKYGQMKEKKGMERMKLDKFSYGYIFALAMGLMRYMYAH